MEGHSCFSASGAESLLVAPNSARVAAAVGRGQGMLMGLQGYRDGGGMGLQGKIVWWRLGSQMVPWCSYLGCRGLWDSA